MQLETVCQEIVDLKTRLDVIQVKYENAKKKIGYYIPHIPDLECAVSKKIAAYNQVIHFKKIADKLEPQVLELQDFETLSISLENLLAFTFEAFISEVVEEVGAQAGAARGEALDNVATKSVVAARGVATE
ncbi:hypothetical protein ACFXTO_032661 [Malus domestica]